MARPCSPTHVTAWRTPRRVRVRSMARKVSRFPTPRSSWVVVAVWVALAVALAPFGAKVPTITNDEYVLPATSQTARIHKILAERFPGGDERPALIVYRRAGGLTSADRQRILADASAI